MTENQSRNTLIIPALRIPIPRWFKLPERIRVPFWTAAPHVIIVLLVIVYIVAGALVFRALELNPAYFKYPSTDGVNNSEEVRAKAFQDAEDAWDWWNTIFFCFVTITSIGR